MLVFTESMPFSKYNFKIKVIQLVLSNIKSSYFCMKNILILIFWGLLDTSIRVCHQILCWSHSDGHDFGSPCHVLLKIVRPILMRHNIRLNLFYLTLFLLGNIIRVECCFNGLFDIFFF